MAPGQGPTRMRGSVRAINAIGWHVTDPDRGNLRGQPSDSDGRRSAAVLRAQLYFRTLRYLRASQIVGRLRARIAPPRFVPRPCPVRSAVAGAWRTPPVRS